MPDDTYTYGILIYSMQATMQSPVEKGKTLRPHAQRSSEQTRPLSASAITRPQDDSRSFVAVCR